MAATLNTIKKRCMFILLISVFQTSHPEFTEVPEGRVVPANEKVKFFCQNPNADAISWIVNGTIYINGSSIGVITEYGTVNDELRHWLIIEAYIGYNRTTVSCLARYFSNSSLNQLSMTVMLLVQGTLDPVSDIRRDGNIISWTPPFSLDLTNIEPDVTYCVVVDRITCTSVIREMQECGILAQNYSSNSFRPSHRYRITVTAIVNCSNSSGTPHSIEESFVSLGEFILLDMNSATVTLRLHVNNSGLNYVRPDSLIVRLVPIDGLNEQAIEFTAKYIVYEDATMRLSINGVPLRRLWNVTVLHETRSPECTHHLSRPALLSTHTLQRVSVSSPDSGGVLIFGVWINQSNISGVLTIVYSYFTNTLVYHKQDIRGNHSNHFHAHILNVPKGDYNVSLFLVNTAGQPFERAINTPTPVSVLNSSDTSESFGYDFAEEGAGVRVTCKFAQNSNATGCLVFAYPRFSSLSSYSFFKLEIVGSSKLRRYGDTASGLLDGVSLNNSQVGAVEDSSLPLDNGGDGRVLTIAVVCALILVVGALIMIVGCCIVKRYIHQRTYNTKRQKTSCTSPGREHLLSSLGAGVSPAPLSVILHGGPIPALSLFQSPSRKSQPPKAPSPEPQQQLPKSQPHQSPPPESQQQLPKSQLPGSQPPNTPSPESQQQQQLPESPPPQAPSPEPQHQQQLPESPPPKAPSHESQPPQSHSLESSLRKATSEPPSQPEGAGMFGKPHDEHCNKNGEENTDSNTGQYAGHTMASNLAHDTVEATDKQESRGTVHHPTSEALDSARMYISSAGVLSSGDNPRSSRCFHFLEQVSGSVGNLNAGVAGRDSTKMEAGNNSEQSSKDDRQLFKGPAPDSNHDPGQFINPTSEVERKETISRKSPRTGFWRSSHDDANEEQVESEHSSINTSIKYTIMPGDGACASDSARNGPLVKDKTDNSAHPQVTDDLTTLK